MYFIDYKDCFYWEEIGRERRKSPISVLFKKRIIEEKNTLEEQNIIVRIHEKDLQT